MYIFHVHHICSIIFITYLQQDPSICPSVPMNTMTIVLELSAASINIYNLCKQFWNAYARQAELVNILIYFIARIVIYPIVLYSLIYQHYIDNILLDPSYGVPSLVFALLHIQCCVWFREMVLRYFRTDRAITLFDIPIVAIVFMFICFSPMYNLKSGLI